MSQDDSVAHQPSVKPKPSMLPHPVFYAIRTELLNLAEMFPPHVIELFVKTGMITRAEVSGPLLADIAICRLKDVRFAANIRRRAHQYESKGAQPSTNTISLSIDRLEATLTKDEARAILEALLA